MMQTACVFVILRRAMREYDELFNFGYDFMGDGIERKPRNRFDAEFGRDVLAVCQDGIEADEEPRGNLFIRVPADDELEHFFFAVREFAVIVDHREEDPAPDAVVLPDVTSQRIDGEQNGVTKVFVVRSRQMLNHDVPHIVHHGFDGFVRFARCPGTHASPVLLFFAERKELGKPFLLVRLNPSAQFFFERGEDIAQQLQRSIACARRMNKNLQMSVDVGQLILQVIPVRLLQIIDDLAEVKALQLFLRKIIFVDKRVDDGEEKVRMDIVCFTKRHDRFIAYPKPYAETVDNRNKREVLAHHLAHSHICINQRHPSSLYIIYNDYASSHCLRSNSTAAVAVATRSSF